MNLKRAPRFLALLRIRCAYPSLARPLSPNRRARSMTLLVSLERGSSPRSRRAGPMVT
jgi:hypothetical protein